LEQHKKVTQIENNWSLYDLIDQELEYSEQKHWLDQCPDVTPERLNEIVLEVIAELMVDIDLRKVV
jgi:hypothetical protein